MQIEIKNRFTGSLIFECDAASLKVAVELAVSKKIGARGADLRGADLRGADLSSAYLSGADLRGADLRGADLSSADLSSADLSGAKIHDGITITKAPIQITGLAWLVSIWDHHMQIGCEFHSYDKWANFDDEDWLRMGGKEALLLKRQQYPALAMLCAQHQPSETVAAQEQDT